MIGLGSKDEVVDDESVMASVWKAIRAALPDGFGSGNPICSGVPGLGKVISPVNGIDDQKVVCLMAALGLNDFVTMMKDVYAVKMPCDFSPWLLSLGVMSFQDPSNRLIVAECLI